MFDAVKDFLLDAFKALPDHLKLIVFFVLVAVLVFFAIREYKAWLRTQRFKMDLREEKRKNNEWQKRFEALNKIDDYIWKRPDGHGKNHFVDLDGEKRKTRFVAVFNMKGGVGKTTVTVNLGASLALAGKKVLFMDMDYQASMSRFLAEDVRYFENQKNKWTTSTLLSPDLDVEQFLKYLLPATGQPIASKKGLPNASVMIADEKLELVEWEKQARFYVFPEQDARFLAQRVLHTERVFRAFDYVFFDCPPRMTTACINAMTCPDYVIIPSSLSLSDILAIPRTLKWLEELHAVIKARFLGVVVSRCKKISGKLVRRDEKYFDQLNDFFRNKYKVKSGANWIFSSMIPDSPEIHEYSGKRQPIVLDPKAKDGAAFEKLRKEFEQRV